MGIYLNPGIDKLKRAKNGELFVDKSMLIALLNKKIDTNDSLICSSRPRRFGKTMAANMIAAYYSKGCDSHEIFSNLKISKDESFEKYVNKYNVICLDMNIMFRSKLKGFTTSDTVDYFVIPELRKAFPNVDIPKESDISLAIQSIYYETGEKFVIVIDEYDVLVREHANEDDLNSYIDMLIKLFKNNYLSPAIALAYITGILPIIRDSFQSKLNNFKEFTMLDAEDMAPFMGFTVDEVKALADKNNMDFEEIKRWYDGYNLNGVELYSPKSVITAMEKKRCDDYWTQTSSYDALKDFILMNIEGLKEDVIKMIAGESVLVNPSKFRNTVLNLESKDEVLTCLVHMGYLGFRYIRSDRKECFIPNYEINKEWVTSIEDSPKYKGVMKFINSSRELLKATWDRDEELVAHIVEKTHMEVTSNLS